ncbi:aminotransferase class III-fold pyridoxal phosphate-dependent enzyme [Kiloniella sp. b19]|uniref:aminotransferase class III-fold pyridoxal phosphate-dependent enzyme n=1 Tax=Kiloniella sp. GXU_MW_B19 TaxID=3141326 RepID=UPI0031D983CC
MMLSDNVFPVCNYPDVVIETGQGSWVTDTQGRHYLDLNSGQFCAVAGHSSPVLRKALMRSLETIQDTHTGMLSAAALQGLKDLGEISGFANPHSILLTTGSEATEFALRYAKHLKEKDGVLALDVGYHGITHGVAGYSMSRARVRPPLPLSFAAPAPLNRDFSNPDSYDYSSELESLREIVEQNSRHIAAFILEPVISGGGMFALPPGYLYEAVKLCRENDIFVIYDECQTGVGRLGDWFSYTGGELPEPDFVVAGKSLGLGIPVSSVTANRDTVDLEKITLGHFSSHQNEGFSGLIVSECVNWIRQDDRLTYIRDAGQDFLRMLQALNHPMVNAPRGKGFMLAFDLTDDEPGGETIALGNRFVEEALKQGLLMQHCNYGRTIRILPNYNTTREEFRDFIQRLEALFNEFE